MVPVDAGGAARLLLAVWLDDFFRQRALGRRGTHHPRLDGWADRSSAFGACLLRQPRGVERDRGRAATAWRRQRCRAARVRLSSGRCRPPAGDNTAEALRGAHPVGRTATPRAVRNFGYCAGCQTRTAHGVIETRNFGPASRAHKFLQKKDKARLRIEHGLNLVVFRGTVAWYGREERKLHGFVMISDHCGCSGRELACMVTRIGTWPNDAHHTHAGVDHAGRGWHGTPPGRRAVCEAVHSFIQGAPRRG